LLLPLLEGPPDVPHANGFRSTPLIVRCRLRRASATQRPGTLLAFPSAQGIRTLLSQGRCCRPSGSLPAGRLPVFSRSCRRPLRGALPNPPSERRGSDPRNRALSRASLSVRFPLGLNRGLVELSSLSAHQNNRCLMCGAPTPAAHRSAAPNLYPIASRSVRTPASHTRPSFDATCSPKMIGGRHLAMSHRKAGQRWRSSATPPPFPATLNGWHGQLPVQTGSLRGQPANRNAYDQPPMPPKKWHCVNPSRSRGDMSLMSQADTSPSGRTPWTISLSSHWAANGSLSL